MTRLAAEPVDPDQMDLLTLVAHQHTPLGIELAEAFKEACWAEACEHDGWVDPNAVRARLHAQLGDFDPRRYSSLWAPACGKDGYLVKTDQLVPIVGEGSRGNGGKQVALRRWRDWRGWDGWAEDAS